MRFNPLSKGTHAYSFLEKSAQTCTRLEKLEKTNLKEPGPRSSARVIFTAYDLQIKCWKINMKFYNHTVYKVERRFGL